MFGFNKYDKEMMGKLRATSKFALKQQCLLISNFNVKNAEALYEFLIKDMEDLPSLEPSVPSTMESVKDTAGSVFGWVKENKDDILQISEYIRNLVKGRSIKPSATPLPPINE